MASRSTTDLSEPQPVPKGHSPMKAQRSNLCTSVRNELIELGASTVQVLNAIRAAQGECEAVGEESKLGDGRVTKTGYKVTEATTTKYRGDSGNIPLRFDAWNSAIAKAEKIAEFDRVSIPESFMPWVQKFIKQTEPVAAVA